MTSQYDWLVDERDAGERIDKFITRQGDWSRQLVQSWVRAQHITVNKQPVKSNYRLRSGDSVQLRVPETPSLAVKPEKIALDIVYEDADVIVVNKPRGMVVHPAPGHPSGTLVNALLAHSDELSKINGEERPGIVHRLDKDTSGLMMVAKNDDAHRSLAKQLAAQTVRRSYAAIVHGAIPHRRGTVEAPIGRHPHRRQEMAVVHKNGKKAVTHFSVWETLANYTFTECRLETGRTHQIRVHMAYIGHPLVGDLIYGRKKNKFSIRGQALHAYSIRFRHPRTGTSLSFESELPMDMRTLLEEIRFRS